MSVPAKRRATYEDLLAAPENVIAEILDGELVTQPRPAAPHARATSRLGGALDGPFDRGKGGPGGWVILDEPELHLGGDVIVPDLAGWRRERMPQLPMDAAFFELAPDWICEVLSPRTAVRDRTQKLAIYARERVTHVWIVDPRLRTLEVLRLEGDVYEHVDAWRDDAVVRAPPFEAIELELGALWAD
jgi:Uma2 family endonuclease